MTNQSSHGGARPPLMGETVIEVTRVSDKGQVVIPKEIRDKFNFTEGSKLIVVGVGDAVILKRIETVVGPTQTRELTAKVRGATGKLKTVPE